MCGNGVPDRLIGALKEKSSGDGTVVKEGESTPSTSTKYTITYDLMVEAGKTHLMKVFTHTITRQTMQHRTIRSDLTSHLIR